MYFEINFFDLKISFTLLKISIVNFFKILIMTDFSKNEHQKLIAVLLMYFGGIRFSFLSQKFNLTIYFGALLSNVSILAYYSTLEKLLKKHLGICILLISGLYLHSLILNSGFGIMIALSNSKWLYI